MVKKILFVFPFTTLRKNPFLHRYSKVSFSKYQEKSVTNKYPLDRYFLIKKSKILKIYGDAMRILKTNTLICYIVYWSGLRNYRRCEYLNSLP